MDSTTNKISRHVDSFWFSNIKTILFSPLQENLKTDILIIGAGITGLTAAYCLSKLGKKVTVVDAGEAGGAETACTTAHLTYVLDYGYVQLEKMFGVQKAQLILDSHKSAIDFIENIAREEKIDCDFKRVNGYKFLAPGDNRDTLEKELSMLHTVGAIETRLEGSAPVDFFGKGPCLLYPEQAQFHPLKYANGLIRCLGKRGVQIFSKTRISHIETEKVQTESGNEIKAGQIIVATHSPIKNILFFLKEAAYRTYVVASKITKNQVAASLYWDTAAPYHYVRTQPINEQTDLLIVGGEDHKTGQNDDYEGSFRRLEEWAREHFPMFEKTDYVWSGQVIESMDGLAFIGRSPYHKKTYIATGYAGNGMTYGTIAAMIFSDILFEKENKWTELYSPTRKSFKAAPSFVKENINVAKEMFLGHVRKGHVEDQEQLQFSEGAVIKKGLSHLAVYRDEQGNLHSNSAICTHLGCVVQWNVAQKSFDCPCHGSRFNGKGEVITGPAIRNLKKTEIEAGAIS